MFGLPKYFNNLHLEVSAICGTPRIASTKPGKCYTDKYKDIPKEEWESALLNWASHLEHGYVQVTNNFAFAVMGKARSKEHLIQSLRNVADELEGIINVK